MRTLVMGSDLHAADRAAAHLEEAGHEVVRCYAPGDPSFPCRGLMGSCPLDDGDVDVAVLVRQHPWPRPTPFEHGVTCAVRRNVPLVVGGRTILHPYDRWAFATVHGDEGLLEAIAGAHEHAFDAHAEAAATELRAVLESEGLAAEDASVTVTRGKEGLQVVASTPDALQSPVASRAAVRMVGAVRATDQAAPGIDVTFRSGR